MEGVPTKIREMLGCNIRLHKLYLHDYKNYRYAKGLRWS